MESIKKFIREKVIGTKIVRIKVLKNEPIINRMMNDTPKASPCGCMGHTTSIIAPYEDEPEVDNKYVVNEEDDEEDDYADSDGGE